MQLADLEKLGYLADFGNRFESFEPGRDRPVRGFARRTLPEVDVEGLPDSVSEPAEGDHGNQP